MSPMWTMNDFTQNRSSLWFIRLICTVMVLRVHTYLVHVIEFNCFTLRNFRSDIDGFREIRNMKGIKCKAFHSIRKIALLIAFL